jgi:signal transduction histidine kinase
MMSPRDLERRVAVLSRLAETSVTLNSTLELDVLLGRIIEAAADVLECERASILLLDEHTQELRFAASTGQEADALAAIPVPMDRSIAGAIFRENRPLIVADPDKDPRHYTKVRETTGLSTRSLLGVPMRVKDRVMGVLEAVNKRRGGFTGADIEVFSILASQAAVAIDNARMLAALRRAYAELGELERKKTAFIALASHELRTPLVTILGYAEMLRERPEPGVADFAKQIVRKTVHLTNLTQDLTNLRYLETGETPAGKERVDLREVVAAACEDIGALVKAKSQQLVLDTPAAELPVRVDRAGMAVAVAKLLGNAVAFTPENGEIRLRAYEKSGEAWIEVEDTGPGIPPGREEAIFEPFYQVEDYMTRAHGGLGLGLSIVHAMLRAHGGRVWAENREAGPGSRFTAVVPLAAGT